MKSFLFCAISLNVTSAFAMTKVNLNAINYSCNNVKITSQSTIQSLTMNCKNAKVIVHLDSFSTSRTNGGNPMPGDNIMTTNPLAAEPTDATLDKVKFYTDDGSYMICYYNNNAFVKCKVSTHKTKTNASAGKGTASAVKSNVIESNSLSAESSLK